MNSNNKLILNTLNVPIINDFNHLAEMLSLSNELIYFLSFKKDYCYNQIEIPKKNGDTRTIYAPIMSLKVIQRWILKEILEKINVSKQTMAFVPHKNGLKENAEFHKDNIFILEMDITDFFGSITECQVVSLFYNIGYNLSVAALLANLCTYNNILPQGAVTSPYIANLISYNMDLRINGLCSKRDIVYTRYADDLSFSCDNRTKLNSIENIVKSIVNDEGFVINDKKTRYLSNEVKKTITGITINNHEIHVDKKLKRKLRAMIYNSIRRSDYTNNDKIKGYIAYINSIEEGYKDKMINYIINIMDKPTFNGNSDIINAYNNNKIFKELPDVKLQEWPFS